MNEKNRAPSGADVGREEGTQTRAVEFKATKIAKLNNSLCRSIFKFMYSDVLYVKKYTF